MPRNPLIALLLLAPGCSESWEICLDTGGCPTDITPTTTTTPTPTTETTPVTPTTERLEEIGGYYVIGASFAYDPATGLIGPTIREGETLNPFIEVMLVNEDFGPLCTFVLQSDTPVPPSTAPWSAGTLLAHEWSGADLLTTSCPDAIGASWYTIEAAITDQVFGAAIDPELTKEALYRYAFTLDFYPDTVGFVWYHSEVVGSLAWPDGVVRDAAGWGYQIEDGVVIEDDEGRPLFVDSDVILAGETPSGLYTLALSYWAVAHPEWIWD